MTEQAALLTAIAADPGDDVRRLGYADFLDEQPSSGTMTCPKCRGNRGEGKREYKEFGGEERWWEKCPKCDGAGIVADTANHDRAEFIRVQVAIQGKIPHMWLHGQEVAAQSSRMWKLLDRHRAEWSRLPCRGCAGRGEVLFCEMPPMPPIAKIIEGNVPDTSLPRTRRGLCLTCGGTGDLFTDRRFNDFGSSHVDDVRTVTFARGFVESVSCTLDEVVRPDGKATEWARAVVKAAPVVRFVPTDAEARRVGYYGFGWIKRMRQAGLHHVPEEVFRRLTGALLTDHGRDFTLFRFYESPEAAKDALSLASGDFVRAEAYGKAVPT